MQLAHKLLSTRGGTLALATIAALLSAGALLTYLSGYRSSVESSAQPVSVLVAKSLIEKGTPGHVVGSEELFEKSSVPKEHLKESAITDPASLRGRVAADDIYPGQQLTVSDFALAPPNAAVTKITRFERGISVPLDAAHGMLGEVRSGDRVDVLAGFNITRGGEQRSVLRVLVQNVLVLSAPEEAEDGTAGGNSVKSVALRMSDEDAARVAFSSDNGKVWVVLRPKAGAQQHVPSLVTLERLLLGLKPIPVKTSGGAR